MPATSRASARRAGGLDVLVTGGAGFFGSHVVDRLLAAGHRPRIYDLRRSPYHAASEVPAVRGDVGDLARLCRATRDCDVVVHLAAAADVARVEAAPVEAEERNAHGTLNVLEAARRAGVARVVYASTIWVYSDTEHEVLEESVPLRPPRISTRRASWRASCTATAITNSTGSSTRSCGSASRTARARGRRR